MYDPSDPSQAGSSLDDPPGLPGGLEDEPYSSPSTDFPDDGGLGVDDASPGEVREGTISVNLPSGEEVVLAADVDLDLDGQADAAIIDSPSGIDIAVLDTDNDGEADQASVLGAYGQVVATTYVDPQTGEWVTEPPSHTTDSGTGHVDADANQEIIIETDQGRTSLSATEDFDHDGDLDSAVLDNGDGTTLHITDLDGDSFADKALLIDNHGNILGAAHVTPSGEWVDENQDDQSRNSSI